MMYSNQSYGGNYIHHSTSAYHHSGSGQSPRGMYAQAPTSPFVQFSGRTIEEHNITLQRLDEQLAMIARSLAEVDGQEESDRLRAHHGNEQLRSEEEDVIRRQHLIAQHAQDTERRMSEEEHTRNHGQQLHEDEMRDYYAEEKALADLEAELKVMQGSVEDRLYHSREQLRIFRKELEDGMTILENDRHAVRAIATRTHEQFNTSRRTAEVVRSMSPNRAPRSPVPPSSANTSHSSSYYHANSAVAAVSALSTSHLYRSDANVSMSRANNLQRASSPLGAPSYSGSGAAPEFRTVSPNRGRAGMVSSPHSVHRSSHDGALRSPPKPGRHNRIMVDAQVGDPNMSAIRHRNLTGALGGSDHAVTFYNSQQQHSMAPPPERLSHTGSFLPSIHNGGNGRIDNTNGQNTSRGGGNVSIGGGGTALLEACARQPVDAQEVTNILRQDQNAVNELDQVDNTPLHIICMNERPSLDAVHALLLSGSSTTAKNAAGFTPFHCACLNVRGDVDNVPSSSARNQLKKFLIFKGAQNPNQRTGKGETALHLCAEDDKYLPVVEFLVGAGVDPHVTALLSTNGSSRRMKALDVAKLGGLRSARIAAYLASLD